MKKTVLIISLCVIAATAYCQPQGSQQTIIGIDAFSVPQLGLIGPVKTVEEEFFQVFKDGSKMPGNKYTYSFDSSGSLVECKVKLNFNGLDMGSQVYKYSYDKSGAILTIEDWDMEKPQQKEISIFNYNADGNLQSMDKKEGNKIERTTFEPTADHMLGVKKLFHQAETTPYLVQRFTYDLKHRVIARVDEYMVKKTSQKHLFTYEGDNTYYSTESLDGGALLYPVTDCVSETLVYNDKGYIIQRNSIGRDGKPTQYSNGYSYQYDDMGNWISQSKSGSLPGYTTRTIKYFGELDPNSAAGIYQKAVKEGIDPSLKALQFILEMATSKGQSQDQILKNIGALATTVSSDINYVQSIKPMPGNNAKQFSLELLNYIAAPQMQSDLKQITADPAKNNALVESNLQFLKAKIAAINVELQKLH